ncbi:MAG: hypothetical protein KGZ74_17900 [Chitinophagaceae bacterium]|nr:hypothetical protein [Chitinophagaceae bacterium]
MKYWLKEFTKKSFPDYYWNRLVTKRVLKNKESFLHVTGWYNSLVAGKPLNEDGKEIPWLNYGVFHFLRDRLHKDLVLFEYGSGSSTFYFAEQVKKVVSVEHDRSWYEKIIQQKPDNAEISFEELVINGSYAKKILSYNDQFDIVLVDGRDRVNCVKYAVTKLSERGVIILDNSNRKKYSSVFNWDGLKDFKHITFTGILPGGFKPDASTVFYRNENCLGI